MANRQEKKRFNPETFMAALNGGGTVSLYGVGQIVFSQGAPADAVFYIQDGKVKVTVISSRGRKRWLRSSTPVNFVVKVALPARSSGYLRRQPRQTAQLPGFPSRA